METRRLKNIAILILLLLNIFLLLLLGYQYYQARQAATDSAEQLSVLFAADQLTLSRQVDLTQQPLSPLTLSRDTAAEEAMARFLFGEDVTSLSQGGGIISYSSPWGTLQFRSGGGFEGSRLSLQVNDVLEFSGQFCQEFGYQDLSAQVEGTVHTVTGTQHANGVPISGGQVELVFTDGTLTSVRGTRVSLENASARASDPLSCTTALVRFLDHRRTSGDICRQVESVQCIYELYQSSSTHQLIPVWQIVTDTHTYHVDCEAGTVTRQ